MTADYEHLLRLVQGRRSIRSFRPEPVSDQVIEKLLLVAGWAPSASNRQAYRFLAVTATETLEAMAQAVKIQIDKVQGNLREDILEQATTYLSNFTHFVKAPLVLVPIHRTGPDLLRAASDADKPDRSVQAGRDSLCSVSAAIMNLLLGAHALGLGACWMTGPLLARESLEELLRVPAGWAIAAVIPVGFPDEDPKPPSRREVDRLLKPVN